MVFSFFKKPPEKMVARPAVVPRPAATGEKAPARGASKGGSAARPASPASHGAADVAPSAFEGTDFVFSESSPDFQIEGHIDPVDAAAEEAAMLFANGQDAAAGAALENAVREHASGAGERLWLMLFDFYRLGDREADFAALARDYASAFQKAAPAWSVSASAAAKARPVLRAVPPLPKAAPPTIVRVPEAVPGALLFEGDVVGSNTAAFAAIQQALASDPSPLRIDLARVAAVDAAGCGRLLALLHGALKAKRQIELFGRDTLGALVERLVEPARAENKECWLLLLELCQLQGEHEAFEEIAIDYAVTFEVSPPSWEKERVAAPEAARPLVAIELQAAPAEAAVPEAPAAAEPEPEPDMPASADAYVLRGDVKATRFGDLAAHAEALDALVIDCAALTRMDFISAGALLNVLSRIRSSGKQIVFRHPNHLVAELFGVVGLTAIATVVFARQ